MLYGQTILTAGGGVGEMAEEVYRQRLPGFCAVVAAGWDRLIRAPMVRAVREQFWGVMVAYI